MADDPSNHARPGPRTGDSTGQRDARLRAALRSNIAKRKARAHAVKQPENPPHEGSDKAVAPGAADDTKGG